MCLCMYLFSYVCMYLFSYLCMYVLNCLLIYVCMCLLRIIMSYTCILVYVLYVYTCVLCVLHSFVDVFYAGMFLVYIHVLSVLHCLLIWLYIICWVKRLHAFQQVNTVQLDIIILFGMVEMLWVVRFQLVFIFIMRWFAIPRARSFWIKQRKWYFWNNFLPLLAYYIGRVLRLEAPS